MLRLDVAFTGFNDDYDIPADNPFVGPDGIRDEIWDIGLRNPFRFSFDRVDGALYIGDVGQAGVEEVDVERRRYAGKPRPRNYGWDVLEGTQCFDDTDDPDEPACDAQVLTPRSTSTRTRASLQRHRRRRLPRRGAALPRPVPLRRLLPAQVWSFLWDGVGGTDGPVVERTAELEPDSRLLDNPVAFGEDSAGGGLPRRRRRRHLPLRSVPEPGAPLLLAAGAAVLLAARAYPVARAQEVGRRARASGVPGSGCQS